MTKEQVIKQAKEFGLVAQDDLDTFFENKLTQREQGQAILKSCTKMEKSRDVEAAENAMDLMDVGHLAKRHLMELSGGEVKRVFIAQAVAQESRILFLDEPTANLDINYQVEIFRILKKFNDEMKKTIVLITHDINHAARFAKRIVLLNKGEIVKKGAPEEVINSKDLKSVFGTDVCIKYDSEKKPYILI